MGIGNETMHRDEPKIRFDAVRARNTIHAMPPFPPGVDPKGR